MECKKFKIKNNYDSYGDLHKIESLEIVEDCNEQYTKSDDDNDQKIYYTCTKNFCFIPCPCHPCSSQKRQCTDHNIKHIDTFNEKDDAISIRSSDHFCRDKTFLLSSYILKYPGIPKNCIQCKRDLLHHKCYHLDFHGACKFCKFYQYKMFPTTIQELYERKVKEEMWYKSVCPFCDKKFTEPNTKKRHIEMHHMNKKLPCEKCEKSFQCKQSLEYHYLTTHQKKTTLYFACEVCEKTFITKIGLNNHMKFKHTENFEQNVCDICEAKFKHEKYLKAHKLHVHGLDQKTEDYWQDIPRKLYECETCNTKFMRKADLKVHICSLSISSRQRIFLSVISAMQNSNITRI